MHLKLLYKGKTPPDPSKGCEYGIQGDRSSMEDASIFVRWYCSPINKNVDPLERQRIEGLGGYVYKTDGHDTYRVWSGPPDSISTKEIGLSTSRSIGDLASRYITDKYGNIAKTLPRGKYLVSPIPDVYAYDMAQGERGFLILGCDGVFDVLTSGKVCEIAKKSMGFPDACRNIVDEAYKKGSTDNISCMVLLV
jgi:serine/threonine protein phosphatase PrpC